MNESLTQLSNRWRKEAEFYFKQVEEARRAGTPHEQMLSMGTVLRQCAKELEGVAQANEAVAWMFREANSEGQWGHWTITSGPVKATPFRQVVALSSTQMICLFQGRDLGLEVVLPIDV